jgi:hypothetical protein
MENIAMNEQEKRALASQFIQGLQAQNAALLRFIMVQDVVSGLPGTSLTSLRRYGLTRIVTRPR